MAVGIILPSGLTPQQIIDGLGELLEVGLDDLGQPELAAFAALGVRLADAIAKALEAPSQATVLSVEVTTIDTALDAEETKKFGKPVP
jgi:hypothetical protein